jgi:HEXXH motif-containing protein
MGWRDVLWLHPRAVYACALVTAGRPIPPDWRGDVVRDMHNALEPAPDLQHLPGPVRESWYENGLRLLGRGRAGPADSMRLRPTTRPINAASAAMAEACRVMARAWPEAAAELGTLLRVVVYCDGNASSSSTAESTFGAIYVRHDSIDGVVTAFDTLLHEAGHHALILRNSFEPFLTNSLDRSSHPLRPDPRPLHGVLHAAHVLARMATGLTYWAAEADAPAAVRDLRDKRLAMLTRTLATLNNQASWTPTGARFFAALRAQERKLRAASTVF